MAWITYVLFALIYLTCNVCQSLTIHSLNGQWTVSNSDKSYTVSGTVPGGVYTALLDNHTIADPYYRKNDVAYRWIAEEDWTYTRTFPVSFNMFYQESIVLVCEGLDTVASVLINGHVVGTSDNMFRRYVFDVKDRIKYGFNTISVQFKSATKYARSQAGKQSYPILPECVPPAYHGECGVNLVRKAQSSFGWDWSPAFPTQGIWGNISIQAYNIPVIRYVTTETTRNPDRSWKLTVEIFTELGSGYNATVNMELWLSGTMMTKVPVTLTSQKNRTIFGLDIPEDSVDEWWPNGYGNRTLYTLQAKFVYRGYVSSFNVNIGFRTVELVEEYVSADTSQGKTFYFRINGHPVFLKGANWVPADSFQERVTRDYVYRLLKSAAEANMNVIRVWGGGVYESDVFYEIADELGIMIWQDFMFACSMYPTDPAFIQTVSQEVTHQIRRLKHHPSIIAFTGNDENELALSANWYGTGVNFTRYKSDYVTLYKDAIYDIVKQEDTTRPFLASSPSNGRKSATEDWVDKDPMSTLYGDIHEFKYYTPIYDPSQFSIPRMATAYGLQSFPSWLSLDQAYQGDDLEYWSDLNEYRNHHIYGNIQMQTEAIQYVDLPTLPREQRFSGLIYISQITQAVGLKTQTEHYRRWQNRIDDQGQGRTMGALYWMLADVWQAPSWASIEYGGKWKMLHYFAKNFFAPILISPYLDGNDVNVYIIKDEIPEQEVPGSLNHSSIPTANPHQSASEPANNSILDFMGTLYIEMYSWSSMTPLHTWEFLFMINTTAQSVFRKDITSMMSIAGCQCRESCFLYFHLGDVDSGATNWLTLAPLLNNGGAKFMNEDGFRRASVEVTVVEATPVLDEFAVTIATNTTALFVWLDTWSLEGRFSDNGFLLAQPNKTVTFYAWQQTTADAVKAALSVKSLSDVYV